MILSEKRARVVAYMKAMSQVEWTPAHHMDFTDCRADYHLFAGVTYRGLPYVNQMDCSLEEFQSWLRGGVYTGPETSMTAIGVDCSSSVLAAWGKIASSFDYVWTKRMMPFYGGALPVGTYDIPADAESSDQVIAANSLQTMYEAYARLLPGDAVVTYHKRGHVRMAAEEPVIRRNPDGTIGDLSYVVTHEICSPRQKCDGYETCWKMDTKYYFIELLKTGYLPLTCRELAQDSSDPVELTLTAENSAQTLTQQKKLLGELVCNYRIYRVETALLDSTGKRCWQGVCYPLNTVDLKMVSKRVDLTGLEPVPWEDVPDGSYVLTLRVNAADREHEVLRISFEHRRTHDV